MQVIIPQVLRATGWLFARAPDGVVQMSGSLVILENQRPELPPIAVSGQLSDGNSSEISLSLSWDLESAGITDFPWAELAVGGFGGTLTIARHSGELSLK